MMVRCPTRGASEQRCGGCSCRPTACDDDVSLLQALLALRTNAGEEDLSGVALGEIVGGGGGRCMQARPSLLPYNVAGDDG